MPFLKQENLVARCFEIMGAWERYCVVLGGEGWGTLILIHNMNMGKYKNSKNTSIRYNHHIHVSFKNSKMLRVNV